LSAGSGAPDLDRWLPDPLIRITHRRVASAQPDVLWGCARSVTLEDTRALGRLVRLRIPGLPRALTFDAMFRSPPFIVLHTDERQLLSGIVGRIWTIRRDYPSLADPDEFRSWSRPGTARVLFATWVEQGDGAGRSALVSETRVAAVDRRARFGLAAVRPLIIASHHLIGTDGIAVAARRAERRGG
jgi:hypothetical protein